MSLTEMTIQKALDIVDIVTPLMINRSQENRHYFGYSELKGFDIIDVLNALKLFNAFNYYQKGILQKIDKDKILTDANYDNSFITNLCSSLVPDQILTELNVYEYNSIEYIAKVFELTNELDTLKMLVESETVESFLRYCTKIGWDDSDYWLKVYYRLGIVFNPNDEMINTYRQNLNKE
jgi:hypothetical protein